MSPMMVWFSDDELERLHGWYAILEGEGRAMDEDYDLDQKLEAIREEQRRGPGAGRVLARDLG
ncbi:MAG: hypothetical protein ACXVHL_35895 [Solirubrobacteraceae bacterium]